jgi:alpha-beta hydrolase superfamily lysophospholipase
MKAELWLTLTALLVLGAAAGATLIAVHTYRWELKSFRPDATSPMLPGDLQGIRSVTFPSIDGHRLNAWFVPSQNGATIVYAHGSPADRSQLLPEARHLVKAGYGALLFDFPGHGESAGTVDWGKSFRDALTSALDFLSAQTPRPAWIGALGFSMGSCILSQIAPRDPRIRALVLEGTFSDYEADLHYEFRRWGPLTAWPAIWAVRQAGIPLDEMRPIDHIAGISPRPILLVAGTSDSSVPAVMSQELYDAAGSPKELLLVAGAGHGHYTDVSPDYLNRLQHFFDEASSASRAEASRAAPPEGPSTAPEPSAR